VKQAAEGEGQEEADLLAMMAAAKGGALGAVSLG